MKDFEKNIELKVESETLKHDLQEKQHLLIKASKALENLAGENEFKMIQVKEDCNKNLQSLEYELNRKISVLEKEVATANEEADKIAQLLDQERKQRSALENKPLAVSILCERGRTIENENRYLNSKESSVSLESQISGTNYLIQKDDLGMDLLSFSHEKSGVDLVQNDISEDAHHVASDLQIKLDHMEKKISELQQELHEKETELALHEENAVKRDKTIQGLTLALKNREKEEQRKTYLRTSFLNVKEDKSYSQFTKSENSEGHQKEFNSQNKLEKEIQCNQQQSTVLQEEINKSKFENDETASFFGDATSYLSICLDPSSGDQLSVEDLQNMVAQLMNKIKEMQKSPGLEKVTECSCHFKSTDNNSSTISKFAKKSKIPVLRKKPLCIKKIPELYSRTANVTAPQEELQTCKFENDCVENDECLSNELWHAHEEREHLKANKILVKEEHLVPLANGIKAQSDHCEQSFDMEKTITNSSSFVANDEINNAEQELCAMHYEKNAEDVLEIVTDCYDNCTNTKNEMEFLHNLGAETPKIENNSPVNECTLEDFSNEPSHARYDLLVQAQARELSVQRQKIKESHILSVICYKNCIKVLKAFDELLEASDVDYYVAESFQAHLNQFLQWIKNVEYKLGYDEDAYSEHSANKSYNPSCLLPGHDMRGGESGSPVLGLAEGYCAILNQILDGGDLLQEMENYLDHSVHSSAIQVTDEFQKYFYEKLHRTQQSLEDARHMMKRHWRVPLPNDLNHSQAIYEGEESNKEMFRLQNKVLEDNPFSVEGFYLEKQAVEETDKSILDHCKYNSRLLLLCSFDPFLFWIRKCLYGINIQSVCMLCSYIYVQMHKKGHIFMNKYFSYITGNFKLT
uniref:CDK5 regulatory subunit associated protein 2 n=1 Tax=Xenopus tropicalis TaxID=8364 RepID=A0A803JNB2_XENTR